MLRWSPRACSGLMNAGVPMMTLLALRMGGRVSRTRLRRVSGLPPGASGMILAMPQSIR